MSKRATIGLSKPDLQFAHCGSFVTCRPMTDTGRAWLDENVDWDAVGDGVALIEFRYLDDIVTGARADGLICEG